MSDLKVGVKLAVDSSQISKLDQAGRQGSAALRQLEQAGKGVGVGAAQGLGKVADAASQVRVKAADALAELKKIGAASPAGLSAFSNALRGGTGLQEAINKAKEASQAIKRVGDSSVDAAAKIKSSDLGGLIKGAFSVVAIQQFSSAIIDSAAKFDTLQRTLEIVSGSTRKAADDLAFVSDISKKFGVDLVSAAQGFAKFSAATIGSAVSGEQVKATFESVARASAALGLSADQTGGIFLALGQIIGKGKVQAEEFRGQLGERLPVALSATAQALGVTTTKLTEMIDKGEVLPQTLLPALQRGLDATFSNARFDGIQNNLNRIGNAFERFKLAIGDSLNVGGLVGGISRALDRVTAEVERKQIGRVIQDSVNKGLKTDPATAERFKSQLADQVEFYRQQAETAKKAGSQVGETFAKSQEESARKALRQFEAVVVAPAQIANATGPQLPKQEFIGPSIPKDYIPTIVKATGAERDHYEAQVKILKLRGEIRKALEIEATKIQGLAGAEKDRFIADELALKAAEESARAHTRTATATTAVVRASDQRRQKIVEIVESLRDEIDAARISNSELSTEAEIRQKTAQAMGSEVSLITDLVRQKHAEADARKRASQELELFNKLTAEQERLSDEASSQRRALLSGTKIGRAEEKQGQINQAKTTLTDPAELKEALEKIESDFSDTTDTLSQFSTRAAQNMQDAFAQFLFDPFEKGSKGMLAGFVDTLRKMAAEAAAAQIMKALFGDLGKQGGSLGGIFGSILGAIGAGVAHDGAIVGETPTPMRLVSASLFAHAQRFHSGGLVGGEVPIIAQRGETILPRGARLGGGTVVNIIDQRKPGSPAVEAKRDTDPAGNERINITIRDELKKLMSSGYMDKTMSTNYGLKRTGVSR